MRYIKSVKNRQALRDPPPDSLVVLRRMWDLPPDPTILPTPLLLLQNVLILSLIKSQFGSAKF